MAVVKNSKYWENSSIHEKKLESLKKFTWKHLKVLNTKYWLANLSYGFLVCLMICFGGTTTDLMQCRFKYKYSEAIEFHGIHLITQTVVTPLIGIFLQKTGRKSLGMAITGFASFLMVLLLVLLPAKPSPLCYVTFIIYGFAHAALSTASYPCITQSVSEYAVSIGVSVLWVVRNIISFLVPILIGRWSKPRTVEAYQKCLWLLFGLGVVGFGFTLWLYFLDILGSGNLNMVESRLEFLEYRRKRNDEFMEISIRNFEKK